MAIKVKTRLVYSLLLAQKFRLPSGGFVGAKWRMPYEGRIIAKTQLPYDMPVPVKIKTRLPYALTTKAVKKHRAVYDLAVTTRAATSFDLVYGLAATAANTHSLAALPIAKIGAVAYKLTNANIAQDEATPAWTGAITLAEIGDAQKFPYGTAFTLTIGTEDYSVVSLGVAKRLGGPAARNATVNFASSVALLQFQDTVTQNYDTAVSAQSVINSLLKTTVTWNISDWNIPASRLQLSNADRLQTAVRIAAAAGAVIECAPNGVPVVRYKYAFATTAYPAQAPDATFTNLDHVVTLDDQYVERASFTKVTVSDIQDSSLGYLQAEIDSRDAKAGGLNAGGTSFAPGDVAWTLLYYGVDVTPLPPPLLTAGTLIEGSEILTDHEEFITFENVNNATLTKPYDSGLTVVWLGNNLGTLTPEVGSTLITAPTTGLAVAKVTYKSKAKVWGIKSPTSLSGEVKFPIIIFHFGNYTPS